MTPTTSPAEDRARPPQVPSLGRVVHYRLSAQDAADINRARATDKGRVGNEAKEGQTFPMLIVRVWGDAAPGVAVNGQVFLDGTDVFWATSRTVGGQPGEFSWPVLTPAPDPTAKAGPADAVAHVDAHAKTPEPVPHGKTSGKH